MIGYLSGTVYAASEKRIVVLTAAGVGYEVLPTGSLLADAQVGENFSAEIFTVVREQEITLYGFATDTEKALFEKLIGVSGIGPKTALQMVSTPVDSLVQALEQGDVAFITKLPGIGKKTAERLIIELGGKLDFAATTAVLTSPAMTEATDALQNLGYDRSTVKDILGRAPDNSSTEALVKFFLSARS